MHSAGHWLGVHRSSIEALDAHELQVRRTDASELSNIRDVDALVFELMRSNCGPE